MKKFFNFLSLLFILLFIGCKEELKYDDKYFEYDISKHYYIHCLNGKEILVLRNPVYNTIIFHTALWNIDDNGKLVKCKEGKR